MPLAEWLDCCREYARWRYCYEELVSDNVDMFSLLYDAGTTASDAVLRLGQKYDLEDCTVEWGVHQNTPCPLTFNATK